MPDLDVITVSQDTVKATGDRFLAISEASIQEVKQYLDYCKIKPIPLESTPNTSREPYFIYETFAYPLEDTHVKIIEDVLG